MATGSNWYTDYKPATGGFCPKPAHYALYIDGKRVGEYPTEDAAVQAATTGEAARQAEAIRAHNLARAAEHEMGLRMAEAVQDVQDTDAAQAADLASPRQVDYINQLRARRLRDGDGDGFMSYDGDPALLTRSQASAYIDSLRGEY